MLKKLLASALVLSALAATVSTGALSAWDEDTVASGTFAAADINLQSWDAGANAYQDTSTFSFTPGVLVPSQSAAGTTYVKNTGNADLTIAANSVVVVTAGNSGCQPYVAVALTGTPTSLAPGGESGPIGVTAQLAPNTPESCEGTSFRVDVTFVGTTITFP